jgi:hypothetical protein
VGYLLLNQLRSKTAGPEPCDRSIQAARNLFGQFHSFAPPEVIIEPCRRVIPKVLVSLGQLRGLIYKSDKCQRGRPQTYIHFMETPTRLACDPKGKQLYIIGGNYKVTARGIVG